ncbi:hypothetical protein M501DRAFT_937119 [Patellaria atrata CBS 101060]|uniref:DUF3074 domain-containing protein n=1 Tax=Patellaria atrata CBS 101060 TaxID=1346257 RepID=A0A9P4VQF7_9PEZI|nr:hypothetical protein M501DRAFT_937119 [Patellaria atrata CBS 101060]
MSNLHEALTTLRPKDFSDIPLDDLPAFLREKFTKAEIIVNSVPLPPGGDDFLSSKVSRHDVNGATCAKDITSSKVRRAPIDPSFTELQDAWGKPMKLSASQNPLGISVFKMAGHDRHGAWFARSSVHEGLGFTKFKKAMQREFPESLAVQGGPGEGNVRGIGGDKKLERKVVEGVGKMEVYQLSAQFPGPTTPREFITLLLTSDNALTEKSAPHIEDDKVSKRIPRHFMVVSVPVTHPDAPPREGFVRGQYESVEMIREIPLNPARSQSSTNLALHSPTKSRDRGSTISVSESRVPDDLPDGHIDPELNPVEWIMITRSDPGGGIPRFMVERGTPGSIVADTSKFLDWACSKDEILNEDEDVELRKQTDGDFRKSMEARRPSLAALNGHTAGIEPTPAESAAPQEYNIHEESNVGIFSKIADAAEMIQEHLPSYIRPELTRSRSLSSSSTDSSSMESFASAEQFKTAEEGEELPSLSSENISIDSASTPNLENNREIKKLEQRRQTLDRKLAEDKLKEEVRLRELEQKESKDLEKAREKHEKERQKREERYQKEMMKLAAKREKEFKKYEAKKAKETEKNRSLKLERESAGWKSLAETLQKENTLLKEQIGELQRENTILVQRMGKFEQGRDALKGFREEVEKSRKRASSSASRRSRDSKASGNGGLSRTGTTLEDTLSPTASVSGKH